MSREIDNSWHGLPSLPGIGDTRTSQYLSFPVAVFAAMNLAFLPALAVSIAFAASTELVPSQICGQQYPSSLPRSPISMIGLPPSLMNCGRPLRSRI